MSDDYGYKYSVIINRYEWHVIIGLPYPAFLMIMKSNLCSGIAIGLGTVLSISKHF
jgi:hypothetical protein